MCARRVQWVVSGRRGAAATAPAVEIGRRDIAPQVLLREAGRAHVTARANKDGNGTLWREGECAIRDRRGRSRMP